MLDEKYIVTDKEKGLLVTNYVFKEGRTFVKEQWKWGDDSLEVAIKAGRCELIENKQKNKKEVSKKIAKKEKAKKQQELEKMLSEYEELDSESEKASELLEKITVIEGELK